MSGNDEPLGWFPSRSGRSPSTPRGSPAPAAGEHGQITDAAQVADLTDLIRSTSRLDGWPASMRIIARRERPHPGAQLSLFEHHHGWRYHLFATNIPSRLPAGHPNAF